MGVNLPIGLTVLVRVKACLTVGRDSKPSARGGLRTELVLLFEVFNQFFYRYTEWIKNTLFKRTWFDNFMIWDYSSSPLAVLHFNVAAFLTNLMKPHFLEGTN